MLFVYVMRIYGVYVYAHCSVAGAVYGQHLFLQWQHTQYKRALQYGKYTHNQLRLRINNEENERKKMLFAKIGKWDILCVSVYTTTATTATAAAAVLTTAVCVFLSMLICVCLCTAHTYWLCHHHHLHCTQTWKWKTHTILIFFFFLIDWFCLMTMAAI